MKTFRIAALLVLAIMFASCSATVSRLDAVPPEPRLGPMPLSPERLAEYAGSTGFRSGVLAAEANIIKGRFVFHRYGMIIEGYPRPRYEEKYEKLLAEHGVSFDNPGCELPPPDEEDGYNHRMALEVLRRYGPDFWETIDREARQ